MSKDELNELIVETIMYGSRIKLSCLVYEFDNILNAAISSLKEQGKTFNLTDDEKNFVKHELIGYYHFIKSIETNRFKDSYGESFFDGEFYRTGYKRI